jgi:hypothetical protein
VIPGVLVGWQDETVDTLAITVKPFELRLLVNGRDLIDLAREAERPLAQADGQPELAGSYRGLWPLVVLPPAAHLLGQPLKELSEEGRPYLLGCVCGHPGCAPLLARITVTHDTIIWSDFRRGNRPEWGQLDRLGPFMFDRRQYERALRTHRSTP